MYFINKNYYGTHLKNNKRKVYYFENQHEYDNRLSVGDIVNIKFNKVNGINYIKHITNAKKYRSKC